MRLVQLLRGVGARVKEAAAIGLRQATPHAGSRSRRHSGQDRGGLTGVKDVVELDRREATRRRKAGNRGLSKGSSIGFNR